jgi:hypothetical protein
MTHFPIDPIARASRLLLGNASPCVTCVIGWRTLTMRASDRLGVLAHSRKEVAAATLQTHRRLPIGSGGGGVISLHRMPHRPDMTGAKPWT